MSFYAGRSVWSHFKVRAIARSFRRSISEFIFSQLSYRTLSWFCARFIISYSGYWNRGMATVWGFQSLPFIPLISGEGLKMFNTCFLDCWWLAWSRAIQKLLVDIISLALCQFMACKWDSLCSLISSCWPSRNASHPFAVSHIKYFWLSDDALCTLRLFNFHRTEQRSTL